MSSRLWARLKARSSPRNHGGDGPRPVLQPRRDQVCQWRRCVCGVCFCASSRSFYSRPSRRPNASANFEISPINRVEDRVFFFSSLFFFFLLSRTKGKRVKTCCAYAWLARIRRGQSWFERTNAYEVCPVSQKNVFWGFHGWIEASIGAVSGSFRSAYNHPPSIGSKLDFSSIFETTFERESFHGDTKR